MTYCTPPITADSPTIYAIDETIARLIPHIALRDLRQMIVGDPADDDLIRSRIRAAVAGIREYLAHWIGGGADNGRYEICGLDRYSIDGEAWREKQTGALVYDHYFASARITLIGGPAGEAIQKQRPSDGYTVDCDRIGDEYRFVVRGDFGAEPHSATAYGRYDDEGFGGLDHARAQKAVAK